MGTEDWKKTIGDGMNGLDLERAKSIVQTNNGSYVVAGSVKKNGGDFNGWLIKLDSNGEFRVGF